MKKQIYIVELANKEIVVSVVDLGDGEYAEKRGAVSFDFFDNNTTVESTQKVISALFNDVEQKPNSIRLLLHDDYVYSTEVAIPSTTPKNKERAAVLAELVKIIPDTIEEGEWDYKIQNEPTKTDPGDDDLESYKTAFVFVPVSRIFHPIAEALVSFGFLIEAVESVALAKLRHENPVVGLALKQDLRGKDAEVLNIQKSEVIREMQNEQGLLTATEKTTLITKYGPLFGFLISAIILIAIGVYTAGSFLLQEKKLDPSLPTNQGLQENQMPAAELTQNSENLTPSTDSLTASESADTTESADTASSTDLSFAPKDIKIQVLNASGVTGAAAQIASELAKSGFTGIKTGNSTKTDLTGFEIQLKENVSSLGLAEYITASLTGLDATLPDRKFALEQNITQSHSYLPSSSEFDLLMLVGK